jgi:CheY-like chemotaxis protein
VTSLPRSIDVIIWALFQRVDKPCFSNFTNLFTRTLIVAPIYRRLFIIDDDVEDQEIFIEALKEVDRTIQCYTAISGEEAFRQMEKDLVMLPELVFLDLNMPKLNGKQVLKEIKKNRTLHSIPVIMYSTSFAPRDLEEIRQLGAVYHILKPSRFDDLCKVLRQVLSTDWQQPSSNTWS